MRRLAWATDIHLNFLAGGDVDRFCDALGGGDPDAVLLCGDIAESHDVEAMLLRIAERVRRPIYFVLGNHDYYRGSIRAVRERVAELCRTNDLLRYLPHAGVVPLGPHTALVGHDGWADGRAGDWDRSPVVLNDHLLIDELANLERDELLRRVRALGDEAATFFRGILPEALAAHRRVIVVTHVPPFREACWHEGRLSDDDWAPHFTCVASGAAMREALSRRPDREALVLCGHSHGAGRVRILDNLEVVTGGAEYGAPQVQGLIPID